MQNLSQCLGVIAQRPYLCKQVLVQGGQEVGADAVVPVLVHGADEGVEGGVHEVPRAGCLPGLGDLRQNVLNSLPA